MVQFHLGADGEGKEKMITNDQIIAMAEKIGWNGQEAYRRAQEYMTVYHDDWEKYFKIELADKEDKLKKGQSIGDYMTRNFEIMQEIRLLEVELGKLGDSEKKLAEYRDQLRVEKKERDGPSLEQLEPDVADAENAAEREGE
jgi:hypothetical protein